eukprot:Selendium_serpulae@DN4803_c0_g1_i1.p1
MHIDIRTTRFVYYWRWNCQESVCGICTEKFDHACTRCTRPGLDCPPAAGTCGHTFHLHCVEEWLQRSRLCPLCRQEFIIVTRPVKDLSSTSEPKGYLKPDPNVEDSTISTQALNDGDGEAGSTATTVAGIAPGDEM